MIDNAYERMLKSDVKYRFMIDMAFLKSLKSMSAHMKRFLNSRGHAV